MKRFTSHLRHLYDVLAPPIGPQPPQPPRRASITYYPPPKRSLNEAAHKLPPR